VIEGVVTPERRGVIRLRVSRPGGPSEEIHAAIDTGFTGFLALPTDTIAQLELNLAGARRGRLADGNLILMNLYLLMFSGTACCEESRCWKQVGRVWLVSPCSTATFSRLKR
jgi:predicted aspartyl protease